MSNVIYIDGGSATKYLKATGAGSNADPHVPYHIVQSGTVEATQSGAWNVGGTVDIGNNPGVTQSGNWNVGGTVNVAGTPSVSIVSALPAGNNNIGNVDIASSLPAGTNNIGDVDVASGTVEATQSGAWNVGGTVNVAGTPSVSAEQSGTWSVSTVQQTMSQAFGTAGSSGDNTLVSAPGAGSALRISIVHTQNFGTAVSTVYLKDGTTIRIPGKLGTADQMSASFLPEREWQLGENNALVMNLSGSIDHPFFVHYYKVAI